MKTLITIMLCLALSTAAFAQEKPDKPEGRPDGPPPRGGPEGRGPGGHGGSGGPGGHGGMPPRPGAPEMMRQFEVMRGYMELVERYSRLSSNATMSGVAGVVTAAELLKPKGTDAAVAYFADILPKTKNAAVQRAIKLQLVELYKASGQADKALEQLGSLITGAPEGEPASSGSAKE